MAYYLYSLAVDGAFPDADASEFLDLWPHDCLSAAFLRMGNDHRQHWVLTWLMDDPSIAPSDVQNAMMRIWQGLHPETPLPVMRPMVRQELPDRNWLEHVYQSFPAMVVGPFVVFGSHDESAKPPGKIPLMIDAATAFGSGEHGTTRGCLEALADLRADGFMPEKILDMGTGSGILAIAAWHLWHAGVLAVDNDFEAVSVADRHRAANKVPSSAQGVVCVTGDGFHTPAVREMRPFDLVIANILAAPLKEMATDLAACTADGGAIILSGFLTAQQKELIDLYGTLGCALHELRTHEDWVTLTLKKSPL